MKKNLKQRFLVLTLLTLPCVGYAGVGLGTLSELATSLANGVVTSLGYLFFSLAIVAFFWGVVQFIWAARQGSDGDGIKNGKQFMLWGLIALFVMFSVFGIITFFQKVFNIQGQTTITIPNIQVLGGSTPTSSAGRGNASLPGSQNCGPNATRNGTSCVTNPSVGSPRSATTTSGSQNCGPDATWSGVSKTCVSNPPRCIKTDVKTGSTLYGRPAALGGCIYSNGVR